MKGCQKVQQFPHSIISILQGKLRIICDICNFQVMDPRICPACEQIFCSECLRKYYQGHKNCPMCHQKLSIGQFLEVECNSFIDYFRRQLREFKLSINPKMIEFQIPRYKNMEMKRQQQQKCHQHQLPLKYFCETCSHPICSDCGMMSPQHKSHKFIRLNDIYTKIRQKLDLQLNKLASKIFQSQDHSLKLRKKLQKLEIQYMHIKRYTEEYYILLVQKFQQEITSKTANLREVQDKNNKDVEFYQLCRDGICQEIERKSRNQLITETEKILSSFTINPCEPCQPLKVEETFQTIRQLLPDYNNFQFTLKNFSQSNTGIVYSDSFVVNSVQWRLKIYPKGNGAAKGKYLSVFVEMTKAERNQKKYEYKIELINKELTSQNITREYCSAFDIGECWGYNQFIPLQELNHGFINEDQLHFIMGIRNSDYRSLSQDQSNYIAKLQAETKLKQQERQNEIEETNIIDDLNSYSSKNNLSLNNDTKFLKFLENSSFSDQRIIQRKKQRKREMEKGQKDQEFNHIDLIDYNSQSDSKKDQIITNNFQQLMRDFIQGKPQSHQLFIKDQHDLQILQAKPQPKNKENVGKINRNNNKEEQKHENKNKTTSLSATKFISLKQLKSQKHGFQQTRTQTKTQNQSKNQVKPQQKEQKNLANNQQKAQQKYEFYFSNSKKNIVQKIKEHRKQESKIHLKEENLSKIESNLIETAKKCKIELKESKKSTQEKLKSKLQQEKPKKEAKKQVENEQKYQEKRQTMKSRKNLRNSPAKINNRIEESESRKKQISDILQQSKKLQGISDHSKSHFISHSSELKESSLSQSAIRSPNRTGHLRFQREKEQHKHSNKKFKDDDL